MFYILGVGLDGLPVVPARHQQSAPKKILLPSIINGSRIIV
jgi:hypothetical protein